MTSEIVRREPMPYEQLTLDALAAEIRRELVAAEGDWQSALGHAIRAGELLIEAKSRVKHGQWLPWLAANFALSEREAQRYMQLAANPTRVSDLPSIRQAVALLAAGDDEGGGAHVARNTGETEWFTPAAYVDAARAVMGGIDLDPASTPEANRVIRARRFYGAQDDGLSRPWHGRVWLNPPYAQPLIARFCDRLATAYQAGTVGQACALVNNATETEWFHRLASQASAFCFPRGRVQFWHPDRDAGTPLQGQAIVYFGPNVERFRDAFAFGFTLRT